MSNYNPCTCISDSEATCIVHPHRDRASKYKAKSMFIEHANRRLASDNVLLEAENKALTSCIHGFPINWSTADIIRQTASCPSCDKERIRELESAIQSAFDCDMIPISTASDGGAARHSEQVRVADMLRKVMEKDDG